MTFEQALSEYQGMSGEEARREALRIVQRAAETLNWQELPERLAALRTIMRTQLNADA